jgi:intraflagellar transport protein 80
MDTVPHPIAAACADGCLRLMTNSGKVEKVGAGGHSGAITQVRWNHTGTEIATGGEDGAVKTWSSVGMVRATVAHGDTPIYSLAWSPDSTMVRNRAFSEP